MDGVGSERMKSRRKRREVESPTATGSGARNELPSPVALTSESRLAAAATAMVDICVGVSSSRLQNYASNEW